MTWGMPERYVMLVNVLLVAAIAYFAALSVSDVFALRLASNAVPPASGGSNAPAENGGARPAGYYQVIARRDIFNLTPAATAPAQNTQAAADEDLRITLLGTSHISGGRSFAIIEDQNGDQVLYRQGDMIPDAGQLVGIGRDRAIILRNGRQIAIAIPDLGGGAPGQVGSEHRGPMVVPRGGIVPRMPSNFRHRLNPMMRRPGRVGAADTGVRQVAPNRYAVDRTSLNNDMQDMAKLFTQVRAIPNIQNGSSNGFALSEIQPGSIFDAMGLHDGDVVTNIAGQPATDPRKTIAVIESLQADSERSIQLTVLRNGAPVNLSYTIH
jgi:general secretion pathway protein C